MSDLDFDTMFTEFADACRQDCEASYRRDGRLHPSVLFMSKETLAIYPLGTGHPPQMAALVVSTLSTFLKPEAIVVTSEAWYKMTDLPPEGEALDLEAAHEAGDESIGTSLLIFAYRCDDPEKSLLITDLVKDDTFERLDITPMGDLPDGIHTAYTLAFEKPPPEGIPVEVAVSFLKDFGALA